MCIKVVHMVKIEKQFRHLTLCMVLVQICHTYSISTYLLNLNNFFFYYKLGFG